MKKFIVLLALTLAVAIGVSMWNTAANRAVGPEVATSLALEQFADPSLETDTAQRVWNGLDVTTWVNIGAVCLVCAVWGVSYRKELVSIGRNVVG
jgi:hypothetical protein